MINYKEISLVRQYYAIALQTLENTCAYIQALDIDKKNYHINNTDIFTSTFIM